MLSSWSYGYKSPATATGSGIVPQQWHAATAVTRKCPRLSHGHAMVEPWPVAHSHWLMATGGKLHVAATVYV